MARWTLRWHGACYVEVDSQNRLIALVGPDDATQWPTKHEAEYCLQRIPFPAWFPKPYAVQVD